MPNCTDLSFRQRSKESGRSHTAAKFRGSIPSKSLIRNDLLREQSTLQIGGFRGSNFKWKPHIFVSKCSLGVVRLKKVVFALAESFVERLFIRKHMRACAHSGLMHPRPALRITCRLVYCSQRSIANCKNQSSSELFICIPLSRWSLCKFEASFRGLIGRL